MYQKRDIPVPGWRNDKCTQNGLVLGSFQFRPQFFKHFKTGWRVCAGFHHGSYIAKFNGSEFRSGIGPVPIRPLHYPAE